MQPRLFVPDGDPWPCDGSLTCGDVVKLYLVHTEAQQNPATFKDRKYVLRRFADACGGALVASVKPLVIYEWLADQRGWHSNWTKRRAVGTVRTAFGWALKMELIERNPFKNISHPAGERGRPLDPGEFNSMMRGTKALFRRVLVFLYYTGARPSEMANAEWRDFDPARKCITLFKHKTDKRTGKPRRVILHPVVMSLLAWIRRNGADERFIFVNKQGRPWKAPAISWRIKWIRERAEVRPDASLYCCRHSFCTLAALQGIDIATIAELAGHARIGTTQHYLHVAGKTDHLQAAVEQIFRPKQP